MGSYFGSERVTGMASGGNRAEAATGKAKAGRVIEDQEALKQSLLVAYVSDREGYFLAGIQARLESALRRL